jgi:DNA polymerase III sliding clamp (beta) subunit (PCNA family)
MLLIRDYEGDSVQSRYYSPYLLNGLQAIDDKEISFFIKNEMRPLILESHREEYDLTYLVMPVSNNTSRS